MASPAAAQRADVRVEQQNSEAGPASEQVSASQIAPSAPQPVAQLSTAAEREGGVAQLTADGDDATSGTQLTNGPRTAREPDPLSRPSEGRTGAVARVDGEDRCAANDRAARPTICARVIETRAADFNRPLAPVLSPEQRLLVGQRLREAGLAARAADSRTINPSEIDPDRLEGQVLASAALERAAERKAAAERAAAPAAGLPEVPAALIEVILGTPGTPTSPPQR